jgi:hypothetical protein
MRPLRSDRPMHHLLVVAATVGAVAAASAALATASGATSSDAARAATGPKPSADATAHRMRPRPEMPNPKFGARIAVSALFGTRVFANAQVGFALAYDHYGSTLPARTTDGGKTWTINGPQLHIDAADGAEAVSNVGITPHGTVFAYGSSVVDVSTNGGRTWWEAALGENVTAVVPGAHGLVAFVQDQISNEHLNPQVTWQYVSTDGGHHWRYSTSFAATG